MNISVFQPWNFVQPFLELMIHCKKTGIGHRPQFVASRDFKKVLGYIFPLELLFWACGQEHLLGKHDLGSSHVTPSKSQFLGKKRNSWASKVVSSLTPYFSSRGLLFLLTPLLVATGRVLGKRDSDSHGTANTATADARWTPGTLFHWTACVTNNTREGDEG